MALAVYSHVFEVLETHLFVELALEAGHGQAVPGSSRLLLVGGRLGQSLLREVMSTVTVTSVFAFAIGQRRFQH